MIADTVQDQIVASFALREIFLCIVNDTIRANGSNHVDIYRATNTGDFSPKPFGDLHGKRAHATRGAIDQYFLSRSNSSVVAKAL
jgi:hypothetical protein